MSDSNSTSRTAKLAVVGVMAVGAISGAWWWQGHSHKRGGDPMGSRSLASDANRPAVDPALLNRRPNALRRLSDPLVLGDYVKRGQLDKDVAAKVESLMAQGKFPEALQVAESLPKTGMGNRMCSIGVWKEWASHDRDAALDAWLDHPAAHEKNETQGLIWGLAEMENADRFEWVKARMQDVDDPQFRTLIVSDLASQWLLAGDAGPRQFMELAALLPEEKRLRAVSEGLSAAAARGRQLVKSGKLDRLAASAVLRDFLGVQEQMAPSGAAGGQEMFGVRLGALAVEMEGLQPMVEFYAPPSSGLLREQYLKDIGQALKDHSPEEIGALASTDPRDGASLWLGYLGTLDLRKDFGNVAETLEKPGVPDTVLKAVAAEALHQSNDADKPFATLRIELDQRPSSRLKDITLAAMASALDKANRPREADNARAKIGDPALAIPQNY